MYFKYLLNAILRFPFLPLLYVQGKQIRKRVPNLPEASGDKGSYIPKKQTARKQHILFLGESTMAGVGVRTHEEGFAGSFAKEIGELLATNIHWKVYAKSGATATYVTKKIVPKIKESQTDFIVVALGANDAFRLNTPWQWKKDVRELIAVLKAKFPSTNILFCNMPPIKDFPAFTPLIKKIVGNHIEFLGIEVKKIARLEEQVFYFDEQITLENWSTKFKIPSNKETFFSDGIHPSKLTYQIWAKDLATKSIETKIF